MIDYKNYKTNKEQSDYASKERNNCVNKNKLFDWVIFTLITALLWITIIEMLFK